MPDIEVTGPSGKKFRLSFANTPTDADVSDAINQIEKGQKQDVSTLSGEEMDARMLGKAGQGSARNIGMRPTAPRAPRTAPRPSQGGLSYGENVLREVAGQAPQLGPSTMSAAPRKNLYGQALDIVAQGQAGLADFMDVVYGGKLQNDPTVTAPPVDARDYLTRTLPLSVAKTGLTMGPLMAAPQLFAGKIAADIASGSMSIPGAAAGSIPLAQNVAQGILKGREAGLQAGLSAFGQGVKERAITDPGSIALDAFFLGHGTAGAVRGGKAAVASQQARGRARSNAAVERAMGTPQAPVAGRTIRLTQPVGKVTDYGYKGDFTADSNSARGIGSFPHSTKPGSLIPGVSVAIRADLGKQLRAAGIKPGEYVNFKLEDGRTLRGKWDDTVPSTGSGGSLDIYHPEGSNKRGTPFRDARIVGFSKAGGATSGKGTMAPPPNWRGPKSGNLDVSGAAPVDAPTGRTLTPAEREAVMAPGRAEMEAAASAPVPTFVPESLRGPQSAAKARAQELQRLADEAAQAADMAQSGPTYTPPSERVAAAPKAAAKAADVEPTWKTRRDIYTGSDTAPIHESVASLLQTLKDADANPATKRMGGKFLYLNDLPISAKAAGELKKRGLAFVNTVTTTPKFEGIREVAPGEKHTTIALSKKGQEALDFYGKHQEYNRALDEAMAKGEDIPGSVLQKSPTHYERAIKEYAPTKDVPNFDDLAVSPEGRRGVVRGLGGIGSDRVRLQSADGNFTPESRESLRRLAPPASLPALVAPKVEKVTEPAPVAQPDKFYTYKYPEGTSGGKREYIETPAKSVTVPGFEDFDLAIHKSKYGDTWEITEQRTGARVSPDGARSNRDGNQLRTQKQAIEATAEYLQRMGKNALTAGIEKHTAENGLSPRYAKPTDPTPSSLPPAVQPKAVKVEAAKAEPVAAPRNPKDFYTFQKSATESGKKFAPVQARPVALESLKGYDLAIHKNENGGWVITEQRTGVQVSPQSRLKGGGFESQPRVKEATETVFQSPGVKERLDAAIERHIGEHGLSPRYGEPAPVVSKEPAGKGWGTPESQAREKQARDAREAEITDRVEASKLENLHLDDAAKYGDPVSLRGKTVVSLRDGSRGKIRTVDNQGNPLVYWNDEASANNNLGTPITERRNRKPVQGFQTLLVNPRDASEFVVEGTKNKPPVSESHARAREVLKARRESAAAKPTTREALTAKRDAAKAKALKIAGEEGTRLNASTGIPNPEGIKAAGEWLAYEVAIKGLDFAEAAKGLGTEIGKWAETHRDAIIEAAKEFHGRNIKPEIERAEKANAEQYRMDVEEPAAPVKSDIKSDIGNSETNVRFGGFGAPDSLTAEHHSAAQPRDESGKFQSGPPVAEKVELPPPPAKRARKPVEAAQEALGGLRHADQEAIADALGYDLPAKQSVSHAEEVARAFHLAPEIDASLRDWDANEPLPSREHRVRAGMLQSEALRQYDALLKSGAPQGQLDAVMAEVARYASMLYKSGSEAGSDLAAQRIIFPDPEDTAAVLTRAEGMTAGMMSNAARRELVRLSERAKVAKAAVVERLEKKAQEAEKVLKRPATSRRIDVKAKSFGEDNQRFTRNVRDEALKRVKEAFTPTESLGALGGGIKGSETFFRDLVEVGGFYVEGGLRKFGDWAKTMRDEVHAGLTDAELQSIWIGIKAEARGDMTPARTIPAPTVFVEEIAKRLGTQNADAFIESIRDESTGEPLILQKLIDEEPLTQAEKTAVAKAWEVNKPTRTATGPRPPSPMREVAAIVAEAKPEAQLRRQAAAKDAEATARAKEAREAATAERRAAKIEAAKVARESARKLRVEALAAKRAAEADTKRRNALDAAQKAAEAKGRRAAGLRGGREAKAAFQETLKEKAKAEREANFPNNYRKKAEERLQTLGQRRERTSNPLLDIATAEYAKGVSDLKRWASDVEKRYGSTLSDATRQRLYEEAARRYSQENQTARQVKKQMAELLAREVDKTRPGWEKTWKVVNKILTLPLGLIAGMDISLFGNQGGIPIASNPSLLTGIKGKQAGAFKEAFRALARQEVADATLEAIHSRQVSRYKDPDYFDKIGLDLSDPNAPFGSGREETFLNDLPERIPVVGKGYKATNRGYTVGLDVVRANLFDKLWQEDMTLDEAKGLAAMVNVVGGRANLSPKKAQLAASYAGGLFSPRFAASRVQYLVGAPLFTAPTPRIRKIVAGQYARYVTSLVVVTAIGKQLGWYKYTTPNDPDGGELQIPVGDGKIIHVPLTPGLAQYVRLAAQLLPEVKLPGMDTSLTGRKNYGTFDVPVDRVKVLTRFLRSKLGPGPGAVWDWTPDENGKKTDYIGRPTTVAGTVRKLTIPMSINQLAEGFQESGTPKEDALPIIATVIANALGVNDRLDQTPDMIKASTLLREAGVTARSTAPRKPSKNPPRPPSPNRPMRMPNAADRMKALETRLETARGKDRADIQSQIRSLSAALVKNPALLARLRQNQARERQRQEQGR